MLSSCHLLQRNAWTNTLTHDALRHPLAPVSLYTGAGVSLGCWPSATIVNARRYGHGSVHSGCTSWRCIWQLPLLHCLSHAYCCLTYVFLPVWPVWNGVSEMFVFSLLLTRLSISSCVHWPFAPPLCYWLTVFAIFWLLCCHFFLNGWSRSLLYVVATPLPVVYRAETLKSLVFYFVYGVFWV